MGIVERIVHQVTKNRRSERVESAERRVSDRQRDFQSLLILAAGILLNHSAKRSSAALIGFQRKRPALEARTSRDQ